MGIMALEQSVADQMQNREWDERKCRHTLMYLVLGAANGRKNGWEKGGRTSTDIIRLVGLKSGTLSPTLLHGLIPNGVGLNLLSHEHQCKHEYTITDSGIAYVGLYKAMAQLYEIGKESETLPELIAKASTAGAAQAKADVTQPVSPDKIRRRCKHNIACDIISNANGANGTRMTRLTIRTSINSTLCEKMVSHLLGVNLLESRSSGHNQFYFATPQGRQYMEAYRALSSMLNGSLQS